MPQVRWWGGLMDLKHLANIYLVETVVNRAAYTLLLFWSFISGSWSFFGNVMETSFFFGAGYFLACFIQVAWFSVAWTDASPCRARKSYVSPFWCQSLISDHTDRRKYRIWVRFTLIFISPDTGQKNNQIWSCIVKKAPKRFTWIQPKPNNISPIKVRSVSPKPWSRSGLACLHYRLHLNSRLSVHEAKT